MDEHHSWYNGSVWHIHWPYQVYVGQWPIFYGPAILLHILKTIWWRNVLFWIMDQCDSKIDLVKYMWVSDLYFMVHWFYLISLSDLFLYIKKWHRPGVFMPLRALALVLICCHSNWKSKMLNEAFIAVHSGEPLWPMGSGFKKWPKNK